MDITTAVTFLAAIPGVATAALAVGLYRRQGQALDGQRRATIDQQAHKVSAWADVAPTAAPALEDGSVWHRVTIENSGDEAVYGVVVVMLGPGQDETAHGSPRRAAGKVPGRGIHPEAAGLPGAEIRGELHGLASEPLG